MAAILVVEDDQPIADLVALYLRREGHTVDIRADGLAALERCASPGAPPDLVVLDLMLPKLDGRGVARRLRATTDIPIIMLTALDDPRDKIEGLDLGADDYVTKPFDPNELVARVRAVLRRSVRVSAPGDSGHRLAVGNLVIDAPARRVLVSGADLPLRAKEFDLLLALARHAGMALSREQLLERVWDGADVYEGDTRTVDVHISRLRERLAESGAAVAIETLRSVGYRLVATS